jgi:hypothetical protein
MFLHLVPYNIFYRVALTGTIILIHHLIKIPHFYNSLTQIPFN